MIKWLLTLVVALIVLTLCTPWLRKYGRKYGLGRLPGDFIVRYKSREYYLPITTTVLLSLALTLLGRML